MTLPTILTTLVVGVHAAAREAAIAAAIDIDATLPTAVILEGITSGSGPLMSDSTSDVLRIARIAPGCMCCVGNLTLRVTLNRLLRPAPSRLYISLATATHLPQIRAFLSQEPYDSWLTLTGDICIENAN